MLLACSIPVPVQLFADPGHLRQRDFPRFRRLLGLRTNAGFVRAFQIKSLTNGRSRSAFTSDARRSVQHWPCRLPGDVEFPAQLHGRGASHDSLSDGCGAASSPKHTTLATRFEGSNSDQSRIMRHTLTDATSLILVVNIKMLIGPSPGQELGAFHRQFLLRLEAGNSFRRLN